jgi:hypothetical protein
MITRICVALLVCANLSAQLIKPAPMARPAAAVVATWSPRARTPVPHGLYRRLGRQVDASAATVATLPTASSNNKRVYTVTDAATAADCSPGGGTMVLRCRSNGTSWVVEYPFTVSGSDPTRSCGPGSFHFN